MRVAEGDHSAQTLRESSAVSRASPSWIGMISLIDEVLPVIPGEYNMFGMMRDKES